MNVLALDTSAEACSVALSASGHVHSRYEIAPRRHGDLLLPMIREVLAEAGLALQMVDAFAFGRGPGAFTGLRIAAGVVQGLATGLQRRVVPVSTLAAMAHRAWRESGQSRVHVAIDARMGEVYWGSFLVSGEARTHALGPERVIDPAAVADRCRDEFVPPGIGVGTGWALLGPLLPECLQPSALDASLLPDARDVLALALPMADRGETLDPAWARPVYLRDDVVQVRTAPA